MCKRVGIRPVRDMQVFFFLLDFHDRFLGCSVSVVQLNENAKISL